MRAKCCTHIILLSFIVIIKYDEVKDREVNGVENARFDNQRLDVTIVHSSLHMLKFQNS
jgi:hypothetical protein